MSHDPNSPLRFSIDSRLSRGYAYMIFGIKSDNSDSQYATFRKNVPLLVALATAHILVTRALIPLLLLVLPQHWRQSQEGGRGLHSPPSCSPPSPTGSQQRPLRSREKQLASLAFSLVVLAVAHGVVATIALIVYTMLPYLALRWRRLRQLGSHPVIGVLGFLYSFGALLAVRVAEENEESAIHYTYRGTLIPWGSAFNFFTLRQFSLIMDLATENNDINSSITNNDDDGDDAVVENDSGSDVVDALSYMLYFPLYLAGPIACYGDWLRNVRQPSPQSSQGWPKLAAVLDVVLKMLWMEIFVAAMYPVSMFKAGGYASYGAIDLVTLLLTNLLHIWLKLVVIWRFFRTWALCDDVSAAPENMTRFVWNNCSVIMFWKHWHASFNVYLVKYIYLPLGGRKTRLFTIAPIFIFVALWHEFNFKLVAWALLIVGAIAFEIATTQALHYVSAKLRQCNMLSRCENGVGLTLILLNVLSNSVGFSLGTSGVSLAMTQTNASPAGVAFVVFSLYCCAGVILENEARAKQARQAE